MRAYSGAVAADEAALDSLYTDITGTPTERRAGSLVSYRRLQDPITACVHGKGVSYTPSPFVDQWSQWPASDSGGFSTEFLATVTNGASHLATVIQAEAAGQRAEDSNEAAADDAYLSLSDQDRAQWDKAFADCPEPKDYAEAFHPKDYDLLIGDYRVMLAEDDATVDGEFGDQYRSCMKASGYTVTDFEDVAAQLLGKAPPAADIPDIGNDGDASWQAWLADAEAETASDASCRQDAFAADWALLGPQISQFRQDHSGELAAEAAGWQEIVNEAGQPG